MIVIRQSEAIRYLLSGSSTVFGLILENHRAGKNNTELWDNWKTMRHAIDHLQSSWPAPKKKPQKEVTVAQVSQRNIR